MQQDATSYHDQPHLSLIVLKIDHVTYLSQPPTYIFLDTKKNNDPMKAGHTFDNFPLKATDKAR